MRLCVNVLQAMDLPVNECYVKLQVGKSKSKTRVLKVGPNPLWFEEFVFRLHDVDNEELILSIFYHDDDIYGFFNGSRDLVGRVRIPVCSIAAEPNQTLPPTWFSLESPKYGKFSNRDCGKMLLNVSLNQRVNDVNGENIRESHKLSHAGICSKAPCLKITEGKHLMKSIVGRLEKIFNKDDESSTTDDSSDLSTTLSDYEDCSEEQHPSSINYEEALKSLQSTQGEQEMPENLQGGTLLDQIYKISSNDLNMFLFAPNSQFRKALAVKQGVTEVNEGPWTWKPGERSCLTRVVAYTRPPTKLVKSVRATEEQTYRMADGKDFAVFISVSTPEVPYGNTFKVEMLYKMMPRMEQSEGEESSRLIISWGINFHQSTMMKGMIEAGVRQGLKESFELFASMLAQNLKVMDSTDLSGKDHMLATMEQKSDWELAYEYLCNFTAISAFFMVLYVLVHLLLCLNKPGEVQGLEFYGVDLPDSFGELFTCGILFIQLRHVYIMVSHFIQARLRRGSDHGVKSQGDGWVLTVALIEGSSLASLDSTEFSDPYVVFTCNGKMRTSSVKLQTRDPQWNEILEFDAMDEPPSVLDIEVFDFDGPFDQATSLGHAEINFLKHSPTELADLWIPLEGKLGQSFHSKLHLRIFQNTNGADTIKEYLTKMGKEIGKKLNPRSPHKNSTFQKLFGLPPEEFLIKDFMCHLKRKMPLQGRLFLSARIVGFYANLFGHKTKFFFLWEDIEDIQVLPPSLSSVGSPSLLIVLRKGRGLDAMHGAKSQDDKGRLRFHFQSFRSFDEANRTILALWRMRTLTSDQKAQTAEELPGQDEVPDVLDDGIPILAVEDANTSKVYSAELPMSVTSVMEIFSGGKLEHKIMEQSGCLNYSTTTWDPHPVKPGVFERSITYKFSRQISIFGGEVGCTQQKTAVENGEGWILTEVMALHDVPFADDFRVHFRYQIEKSSVTQNSCKCEVFIGITWLKSTIFQQRITRNITDKFTRRLKEIFELVQREFLLAAQQDISI